MLANDPIVNSIASAVEKNEATNFPDAAHKIAVRCHNEQENVALLYEYD